MWRAASISKASQWQRTPPIAHRCASTQPPPPRPFNPAVSKRIPPTPPPEEPPVPKKGILSRIWPFSRTQAAERVNEPKDPARGAEAARRVVREGHLDPRYKEAAAKITALICALPIAIYLSYELWRRRFMGVERKQIPTPGMKKDGDGAG